MTEDLSHDDIPLEELVGSHVLVGFTVEDRETREILARERFHGTVAWVDVKKGIGLELLGERLGDKYVLPPDTRSFQRDPRGDYCLKSNGEVVSDPDFLATWFVSRPKSGSGEAG